MSEELRACPFCGGRAELKEGIHTQYVMCLSCEVMGPNLRSKSELVEAWNRRASLARPSSAGEKKEMKMTPDQIKHMVDQFLAWRLPDNFAPDGGVSFKAVYNEGTSFQGKHEPSGTNLLDAQQAETMVRHMLEGMPFAGEKLGTEDIVERLRAPSKVYNRGPDYEPLIVEPGELRLAAAAHIEELEKALANEHSVKEALNEELKRRNARIEELAKDIRDLENKLALAKPGRLVPPHGSGP